MKKTGNKLRKEQSAAGQVGFRFPVLTRAWDSESPLLRRTAAEYSKPKVASAISGYCALPKLATVLHARKSNSSAKLIDAPKLSASARRAPMRPVVVDFRLPLPSPWR
jgi:hypothetical protein